MKKLFFLFFISFFMCKYSHGAADLVAETPVKDFGTPVTVSISTATATLTMVPTTQTAGRIGIFFDNPSTNTSRMVGFFGNCTSTALASTIRPLEFAPGNNSSYIPLREDVCMWLISLAASAENAHFQEVKQ